MPRYLAALIWPVGLVLILGVACLLAARAPASPGLDAPAVARETRRRGHHTSRSDQLWAAVLGSARLVVVACLGCALVYGIMALLGLLVVHHGLTIDKPIYTWIIRHHVHPLAALLNRLTKIGNTWTTWGAAAAAAVCLAVTMRRRRWLAPVAFATAMVLDHYTTQALRHTFHRLGPPISPLGTYPSGGCDRILLFYGLIGYLLWREFSGQRRAGIWTAAAVAALAFNEAFSRVYLGLHWFTDALSGLLYGSLLLAVFVAALQVAEGRVPWPFAARQAAGRSAPRPAGAVLTRDSVA
jgi:membrane-associated phospholipid phosphatase